MTLNGGPIQHNKTRTGNEMQTSLLKEVKLFRDDIIASTQNLKNNNTNELIYKTEIDSHTWKIN